MSKKTDTVETINNDVKEEVKEEVIPKKVKESFDSLMLQAKKFGEDKVRAATMETKAVGALEVMIQMYPKLQEKDSDS
tara:strand:+ start:792 stop:1025 length:234 start_codon:yes stop_codon:yes gene_type:complete